MSGFSQSIASSQNSRGTKRKWVLKEDVALVVCMVDLYNVGTYNADTRFKVDYLNELERMLEKVIPHAMLKAKPNLVSRIRTFKRDWAIIYDILSGKDNSDFDRAIGKNAQIAADIVEEMDAKDMDVSATQSQPLKPNHDGSILSKKKNIFLMEVNKFILQLLMLPCYWGKTYRLLALN
ncbi:hypothetical protein Gogos_003324 [Gossypium gossypioides]|uniref:Myb/SANT-like domain-containing protein n=1 Tax=Gossypium gossypioides TaxID=34282 RepID=A0A7J9CM73_GOSGO|nr:hypothetical protein [Gossypium gossypioides]